MNAESIANFILYAKKKGYDASIILFDGDIYAIMNPVNSPKIHEAKIEVDNMDLKPSLIMKKIDEAIAECGKLMKEGK